MRISTKLAWTLGGVLLLNVGFASQKEGDFSSPNPPFGKPNLAEVSKRLESVEKKLDQVSETKMSDVLGGKNPPGLGSVGYSGFFTNFSFLYWKAFNHGWLVAHKRSYPISTSSGSEYTHLDPIELHFDWSPGLRWGLGYKSKYDSWNFQGIYTWIRFGADKKMTASDFAFINATISLGIEPNNSYTYGTPLGFYKFISARWSLNHNVGDIQFARDFFITKALILQPLLGARVATLFQTMNAHFGQNTVVGFAQQWYAYKIRNNYWGIGPRIGVDCKWVLPHNVGFTGLITGSLLYGKVTIEQLTWSTTTNIFQQTGSARSSENMIAPNLQMALGLDWGMSFYKDKMYWGMNIAWELNYWWNHAHFDIFRQVQFPIEMQGLTFRTDFQF
jgi:hypothetical protein